MPANWETYLKLTGSISQYPSVTNLLMHLKHRQTASEGTRASYCNSSS